MATTRIPFSLDKREIANIMRLHSPSMSERIKFRNPRNRAPQFISSVGYNRKKGEFFINEKS